MPPTTTMPDLQPKRRLPEERAVVLHVCRDAVHTDRIAAALGPRYAAVLVRSAERAFDAMRVVRPHLVVAGPDLPEEEAFQLWQEIRSDQALRATAFVILTARMDQQLMQRAYGLGADAVLPLSPSLDITASQLRAVLARAERYRSAGANGPDAAYSALLTPDELPQHPDYDTAALTRPVSTGGGDLLTWVEAPDNTFYIAISDVEGKGYQAKSFAFSYRTYIRTAIKNSVSEGNGSPAFVLSELNRMIAEDELLAGKFFSVVLLKWDPANHFVAYANAGHCEPMLVSETRSGLRTTGSMAMGLLPDEVFHDEILSLAPGESILLYTDGLTELKSVGGGLSGKELLQTVAHQSESLEELADNLLAACGRTSFDDDVMAFRLHRLK